jgi:D-aminoacyl-tRNA deacylase
MRAVLQRVESAKVTTDKRLLSEIGRGMVVLLGIAQGDSLSDAVYLSEKIIHLRIFEDKMGKMNLSLLDIDGEMLVVSQFTLLGDCRKGKRPSFTGAEKTEQARYLYDLFLSLVRSKVRLAAEGEFQTMMTVTLSNDGPVTILLDSKRLF